MAFVFKKLEIPLDVTQWLVVISSSFIVVGFLTDIIILGGGLYKLILFRWLFALVFSGLMVVSNVLAKKDIYAITNHYLPDLLDAQLLIAIVNAPVIIIIALLFLAMFVSVTSLVLLIFVSILKKFSTNRYSRVLLGTSKVKSLIKSLNEYGPISENRIMGATISMLFFLFLIVYQPEYDGTTLKDVKSEIIVWTSFLDHKDCKNLKENQKYLVHQKDTIVVTLSDDAPLFAKGECEKAIKDI
ncbi:hypothetical protein L4D08_23980 [Photobacterium chitinilyticum]|uniref:hypothetical protein n=1 Tax=Photobacterium chitinilyticum TaxID=2485123 RepID=UPI003D0DD240